MVGPINELIDQDDLSWNDFFLKPRGMRARHHRWFYAGDGLEQL